MKELDYITPFYNEKHSRDAVINSIDRLLNSHILSSYVIPFSSTKSVFDVFAEKKEGIRKLKRLYSNKGLHSYELKNTFKENGREKEISGCFFVYEHPDYNQVFAAITIEPQEFINRVLLPYIKSRHPDIITTFITHKKLKRILDEFIIKNQFSDIIIKRASHRLRLEDEGKHKKIVPMVSWPDMELNEAFDWVYQNNGWFQSLQFDVKRDFKTEAEVFFTRQGIVRTNRLFSKIFDAFVHPVCKTIYGNIQIFGHRSRREYADLSARPLSIDFEVDQFSDTKENNRFIQAVKRLKTASVSVLHGNPYVQLSVIDYFDGSTFDLWVLSSNRLVIVPQMKGTIPAIKRLINHIFDTYAEGNIRDFEESRNES